jgi:hypothetical protein
LHLAGESSLDSERDGSSRLLARAVPWGVLTGGVGVLAWVLLQPRTPDLAAQVYRVNLFRQLGFSVWDDRWYAGHQLAGYSLTFPALAGWLGIRTVGVAAALTSAVLFERIARTLYGEQARWGAVWFAVAAVADLWIGRVTFALGVALALAAVWALMRGRTGLALALAALCAASTPVAGALLAMAGISLTVGRPRRSPRYALALAGPVAVVLLALVVLFPEGGYEPFPTLSFMVTAAVALGLLAALGRQRRTERLGAMIYLAVCALCLVLHTPMGSNIERYGVLLAGPLLLCCTLADRPAGGRLLLAGIVMLGAAVWTVWGPVRETAAVAGNASTSASYYLPVERFMAAHGGATVRVEVPFTRGHWEAAWLAPSVSLARGWEKQLDERYDGVLLAHGLTAAAYRGWLRREAVGYVALPDTTLDPSSAQEGRLIRAGLPYLGEVLVSRHWRIYRVLDAVPLAEGPGRLSRMGHDSFSLNVDAPGSFLVRVRFTRYWTVTSGNACVGSVAGAGGWTQVMALAPGTVRVAARFSLGRALGLDAGGCHLSKNQGEREGEDGKGVSGGGGGGSGVTAGRGSDGEASSAATSQGSLDYRWLVPVAGAAVSIARENQARGTRSWRLAGPPGPLGGIAKGSVEGYVAAQAITAGQVQRIYVNAPRAGNVTVRVYRMGWYDGLGGRLVLESRPLRAVRQPPCTHQFTTGLTECDWRPTLSFPIPAALSSGVYIVKLQAGKGDERDCMFVVRATRPSGLLVEIPTATYEAYNAWGGDSLYPGGTKRVGITGSNQGVEVSYDRPYDSQTGAGQFFIREIAMVRFLERYGYPVSYTTIESIDGEPHQVEGARALMDIGHSEYWSQRDEQAFARARDRGTSLIFISSDTMAWRVRFAPAIAASSQAGEADHVIVGYKETVRRDPDRALPSGLFPQGGANLVGSAYNGCITPRVQRPGPPTYRYYTWTPAPALQPAWLFAGTGVRASTRIPGIVGYETDQRIAAAPSGTRIIGTGAGVPCLSEDEPSPVRGNIAQSTLYTAPSGALVFATGTLGWEYALSPVPQASPDAPRRPDPRVVAMTRNLLARVLGSGADQPAGASP